MGHGEVGRQYLRVVVSACLHSLLFLLHKLKKGDFAPGDVAVKLVLHVLHDVHLVRLDPNQVLH